jgi:hypothetical protein
MKPQTKIQIKVDLLARRLRPMTKNHERFFLKCFEKIAFSTSQNPCSVTWCSECGYTWRNDNYSTWKGENIICPKCGANLHFMKSRASKKEYKHYATIITTVGDMQVFRTFRIEKICRKNQEAYYNFFEVVQNWIDERGHEVIRARSRSISSYVFDAFSSSSIIEIRKNNPYAHHLFSDFVYPKMRIIPNLRRNGYRIIDECFCLSDLAIHILQHSQSEMLIKTGQDKLLIYLVNHAFIFDDDVMSAIKICNRNGYIVKDANLWLDYMLLLEYFHKDIHNSKYVCPEDLEKAHDVLNKKKIRIEKNRRLEYEIRREKISEEKFLKEKSKFFDINFSEDEIKIEPLRSIRDFFEEGKYMHHCVYSMRYFEKPKSLILSARKKKTNERIETIEVNLDNYKIIQSRGIYNSQTEQHDKIMGIVMSNMDKIRKMQRCG